MPRLRKSNEKIRKRAKNDADTNKTNVTLKQERKSTDSTTVNVMAASRSRTATTDTELSSQTDNALILRPLPENFGSLRRSRRLCALPPEEEPLSSVFVRNNSHFSNRRTGDTKRIKKEVMDEVPVKKVKKSSDGADSSIQEMIPIASGLVHLYGGKTYRFLFDPSNGHQVFYQTDDSFAKSPIRPYVSDNDVSSSTLSSKKSLAKHMTNVNDSDAAFNKLVSVILNRRMQVKGLMGCTNTLREVQGLFRSSTPSADLLGKSNVGVCKICMDEEQNCVILDCAHIASCMKCVKNIDVCPMCRKTISKVIRVYPS